jgi:phosphinothricin acetyltransferase
MIRQARPKDADDIAIIYNHYILNTVATFEEEVVSGNDMSERIMKVQSSGLPWFIAEEHDKIIGYAYATKWSERSAYRFSAEVSVYLSPASESKGWGTKLYEKLFKQLQYHSIHIVIGVIALPNAASIALHEKFGMEKIGCFKEIGYKFNEWIDVGYWQMKLST